MSDAILPMPPYNWQQDAWDEFCLRHQNDKLPHAFLLAGQDGIGVEDLALAMGQFLLCLSPLKNIACGKCRSCQLLNAQTHPDLLSIFPDDKGKQIKVDQIREISHFVDQTAQQGGFKVIVLGPAEAMNINAANALLKNLEEPAGKTVFFLVSHQSNRVLPTIRSRCAKIVLHKPRHGAALEWFDTVGLDNGEALLHEAKGAPLLAKLWHDEGLFNERLDLISDLTKIASRSLEPMNFAKKWSKQTPDFVLAPMLSAIESLLALKMAERSCPDHYQKLAEVASSCSTDHLFRLRDRLCEKKSQFQSSPNLNSALFVEELALDWAAILTHIR